MQIELNAINEDNRVGFHKATPPLKHQIILDALSNKTDIQHLCIDARDVAINEYIRGKLPISTGNLINGIVRIIKNNTALNEIGFLYLDGNYIGADDMEQLGEALSGKIINELSLEKI